MAREECGPSTADAETEAFRAAERDELYRLKIAAENAATAAFFGKVGVALLVILIILVGFALIVAVLTSVAGIGYAIGSSFAPILAGVAIGVCIALGCILLRLFVENYFAEVWQDVMTVVLGILCIMVAGSALTASMLTSPHTEWLVKAFTRGR